MAPAFTEARVRELAGLFYDKTAQMVEQLRLTVATEKELDVTRWLSRCVNILSRLLCFFLIFAHV